MRSLSLRWKNTNVSPMKQSRLPKTGKHCVGESVGMIKSKGKGKKTCNLQREKKVNTIFFSCSTEIPLFKKNHLFIYSLLKYS